MEQFTTLLPNDIINEPTYKTLEEIPVSTPHFTSQTSQICYISIKKSKVLDIMNKKTIPTNIIAYEYKENINKKADEEILVFELDTTNMIDLTNRNDYLKYINIITNKQKLPDNISLIRQVYMSPDIQHPCIIYKIKDYRCIKNIHKIQQP